MRLAVLAALLALAACGGDDERAPPRGQSGDPGFKVFVAQGCGSCHVFGPAGSSGAIGPKLDGLGDEAYVRESIVDPSASVARGESGIMPEDFAKRLSPEQLDDLVAFIARPDR